MFQTIRLADTATFNRLIDGLNRFAAEYGAVGRKQSYLVLGKALVHERVVAGDPKFSREALREAGKIRRVDLPFRADRIDTRTNARIFGFRDKSGDVATVKILMRHQGANLADQRFGNTLFRDVRARRMAEGVLARASSGAIVVPKILQYDRSHGRWLVEEQIRGQTARREDIARLSSLDIAAVYGAGSHLRKVGRRTGMSGWLRTLKVLEPDLDQPDASDLWPVSLIHSDLSGNIMATEKGRLCLIDWELAAVGGAALDLAAIYKYCPPLGPELLQALRKLDPDGKAIKPATQMAIGVARLAAKLLERRPILTDQFMRSKGVGLAEAETHYDGQLDEVRRFLRALYDWDR